MQGLASTLWPVGTCQKLPNTMKVTSLTRRLSGTEYQVQAGRTCTYPSPTNPPSPCFRPHPAKQLNLHTQTSLTSLQQKQIPRALPNSRSAVAKCFLHQESSSGRLISDKSSKSSKSRHELLVLHAPSHFALINPFRVTCTAVSPSDTICANRVGLIKQCTRQDLSRQTNLQP